MKVQIPLAINSIGNLATEVAFFGYVRLLDSLFDSSCGYPPHTTSYKNLQTRSHVHPCLHPSWTCSHEPPQLVFRPSPTNRLIFTQTHHSVNRRNHFALSSRTMYACQLFVSCRLPKKHEPASGVAAGVSAAYRFCTSKIKIKSDLYPPRNIFWPYTLQPPRRQEFQPASQLSPIVTNTVPWIICESFVTSTANYTLKARWFVFALESLEELDEQNMTTFTIVVLSNHVWKSSQVLPAHIALPMHLPGIFYTGVKVQIPLAICNQNYHIYNLAAEVRTLGRIVYIFQLLVLLQAPKPIDRSITQTQEWFMHASFSILACRLPKNVNQPLELQLGLLRPVDFAHPRSQSNRMGTRLPSLKHIFAPHTLQPPRRQEFQPASQLSPIVTNRVPWIICESFVTFSHQCLLASLL